MRGRPAGLLLDLDGTVWDDGAAILGVPEAIERLRGAEVPLRFATNITRVPRRTIAGWLDGFGIAARPEDIFTPPLAAAAWLTEQGFERILLCLPKHTFEEFGAFTIGSADPEAVVIGDMGPTWSYDILNTAFRCLLEGAEFVALHRNRYWKTPDGFSLDAGAFVAALEYATGRKATLVGKPSQPMFEAAARSMRLELSDLAMVGDTLESDIAGAQAVGCQAILVRTGKFDTDELARSDAKPDLVVDSLAVLPDLLLD
jgi:HAD superfamily hydrolase (TIGR01458 family)